MLHLTLDMTPILRQALVALSPLLAAVAVGGSVVYPTQLLHQLKANDSAIYLDIGTFSWIGSIYGLAGIPVVFLPIIMQWRGRKLAHLITCSFFVIGWALAFAANSTAMYLASESFQGLGTNSLVAVSCMSMTEMLAPKFRLLAMQLFSIMMAIGMLVVGISGRFIHTKTISVIMFVPSALAMVAAFIWPESPSWLASKGEFEKCEQAFIWLRGVEEQSKTELEQLIAAQKENLTHSKTRSTAEGLWKQITSRDFYMPSIHIFILMNMLYGSGGDVVLVYFLELVEKTSQSEDAVFYAGIILYMIVFSGCIITNITTRYFNNKTVLLSSTAGVIASLIAASIVTYLQSIEILAKDSLACMYCLISFMVFNGLGLNSLVFFIGAELMPVKHRHFGGAFYIITNCGLYALTLKISPYLIKYIGMWGTFTIFTVNAIVCALYVWKYVPETKGRTLQELEDFYINKRFVKRAVRDMAQLTT